MRLVTHLMKYGLAVFVASGLASAASAQTVCSVDITAATPLNTPGGCDRIWGDDADEAFIIIDGPVFVLGTSLTIEDGTIVRGQPRNEAFNAGTPLAGFPGTLIVGRGAFLNARGNPGNPIIFTTAAVDNNSDGIPDDVSPANGFPDDWTSGDLFLDDTPATNPLAPLLVDGTTGYGLHGGLVLVGSAPTNLDDSATGFQGEGICEGLPVPGVAPAAATFGGNEPHDSSGALEYFSVRYAGDEIAPGDELNGITLCGIGDGTIVSYGEAYANSDDGFEMFGGTVNLDHIVVAFTGDDSIDVDQGYQGTVQFALTLSTFFNDNNGVPVGSGGSGDAAGEFDGEDCPDCFLDDDGFAFPATAMVASNWTHIGNQPDAGVTNPAVSDASANQGIDADTQWNGTIANSIIIGQGSVDSIEIAATAVPPLGRGLNLICSTTADSAFNANAITADDACEAAIATGEEFIGGGLNFPNFGGQVLAQENMYFLPTGVTSGGKAKLAGSKTTNAGVIGGLALDPRPANPGNAEVSGGIEPHWPGMDRSATYRGAFPNSSDLWLDDWSAIEVGGLVD